MRVVHNVFTNGAKVKVNADGALVPDALYDLRTVATLDDFNWVFTLLFAFLHITAGKTVLNHEFVKDDRRLSLQFNLNQMFQRAPRHCFVFVSLLLLFNRLHVFLLI